MTLGCPEWDLQTICTQGAAMGFDAVDFRGLLDEIDVTKLPQFTSGMAETKRMLSDAELAVSGISTSLHVCDAGKREANIEEAKRTIDVGRALNVPNIRVFGYGDVPNLGHEAAAKIGADTMQELLELPDAHQFKWCFETHDHWVRAADCKLLLNAIDLPNFGALWDLGHTWRVGKETSADTWAALKGRVFYVHVKDAVHDPSHPHAPKDSWRYVAPGTGELPLKEAALILLDNSYDGYWLFEHEKRWHPNLAEPEIAFPQFIEWAKGLC